MGGNLNLWIEFQFRENLGIEVMDNFWVGIYWKFDVIGGWESEELLEHKGLMTQILTRIINMSSLFYSIICVSVISLPSVNSQVNIRKLESVY